MPTNPNPFELSDLPQKIKFLNDYKNIPAGTEGNIISIGDSWYSEEEGGNFNINYQTNSGTFTISQNELQLLINNGTIKEINYGGRRRKSKKSKKSKKSRKSFKRTAKKIRRNKRRSTKKY